MCKFYSAIVLKSGELLHNPATQSHEVLIVLHNLRDNGNDFIRVEYTPKCDNYADLSSYELTVDEKYTPGWWTEELAEKIRCKLQVIVKRIIITDERKILVGGCYLLAGDARVFDVYNSYIIQMRDNSSVGKMLENSSVGEMLENSSVGRMRDNSKIIKDNR